MARRPRIDYAGFHHIINRGVERKKIFKNDEDKNKFLSILCKACALHKVLVHTYCLMDNHYHILLETSKDNLSLLMRHINANYAMYFNKKYQRKGPLWTGRYKSYYVLNDDYLYRLLKYIEYNPVDAKISKHIGEYTFTLIHTVLNNKMKVIPCAKDSKILLELNELKEYLQVPLSKKEVKLLHEDQKKVIIKTDYIRIREKSKELNSYFHNKQTLKQRNDNVLLAIQDGYKQSEISKYLSVSPSMISKIFRGIK